jgi:hypothetical protein
MTQKKREFGLAAQLTQPRAVAGAPSPLPEPIYEPPATSPSSIGVESEVGDLGKGSREPISHSDHTDRIERSGKQKKPGAPQRAGGYVRRTITLGPALSDYVDRAWRTHRTIDGKYVKGVSGFIEAIIDEHRRRAQ